MGRYCADGYRENHSLHRVIFCIGKAKKEEFETHIKGMVYKTAHTDRSCIEYKIISERLENLLNDFGTGSKTKTIPNWIVDLPVSQLKVFLNGYLSGDGHRRKDRATSMFCTVSEEMALSLQDIIIKVFNIVPTMTVRNDTRKDSFNKSYCGQWSDRPKDQIVIDDKIIVNIKEIKKISV